MIKEQRTLSKDDEISQKLDEMAEKLSKKTYDYETYTKDMLFMTELQEVLN
jgi:predicted transcriptional regulator